MRMQAGRMRLTCYAQSASITPAPSTGLWISLKIRPWLEKWGVFHILKGTRSMRALVLFAHILCVNLYASDKLLTTYDYEIVIPSIVMESLTTVPHINQSHSLPTVPRENSCNEIRKQVREEMESRYAQYLCTSPKIKTKKWIFLKNPDELQALQVRGFKWQDVRLFYALNALRHGKNVLNALSAHEPPPWWEIQTPLYVQLGVDGEGHQVILDWKFVGFIYATPKGIYVDDKAVEHLSYLFAGLIPELYIEHGGNLKELKHNMLAWSLGLDREFLSEHSLSIEKALELNLKEGPIERYILPTISSDGNTIDRLASYDRDHDSLLAAECARNGFSCFMEGISFEHKQQLASYLVNAIDWDYWCRHNDERKSSTLPALEDILCHENEITLHNPAAIRIREEALKIVLQESPEQIPSVTDPAFWKKWSVESDLGDYIPILVINYVLKYDPFNQKAWDCIDFYMLNISEETPYEDTIFTELKRNGLLIESNPIGKKYLGYTKLVWYDAMWKDIIRRHRQK